MQRKTKIIILVAVLLLLEIGIFIYLTNTVGTDTPHYTNDDNETIGKNDLGNVGKHIYGNPNATKAIALITGIHPREKLAIDPEIKAAREFGNESDDVKIIHYQVDVTKDPEDYEKGRANGESLVHDFVNPDVTNSDADCVIISHSHVEGYGEGFYLATPEMDDASVKTAGIINNTTEFKYYPRTGYETYHSTSATLVSKPIAQAGYPTFVYEIPENISDQDSTEKAKALFKLMVRYT
ncbi:hypothetical protein [Methanobrevibacter sp.]|uniref:hypothetical protein n=1 Tax=Methanobrevibacter sp. TaxID=66852 RepID=UPI00388D9040